MALDDCTVFYRPFITFIQMLNFEWWIVNVKQYSNRMETKKNFSRLVNWQIDHAEYSIYNTHYNHTYRSILIIILFSENKWRNKHLYMLLRLDVSIVDVCVATIILLIIAHCVFAVNFVATFKHWRGLGPIYLFIFFSYIVSKSKWFLFHAQQQINR